MGVAVARMQFASRHHVGCCGGGARIGCGCCVYCGGGRNDESFVQAQTAVDGQCVWTGAGELVNGETQSLFCRRSTRAIE